MTAPEGYVPPSGSSGRGIPASPYPQPQQGQPQPPYGQPPQAHPLQVQPVYGQPPQGQPQAQSPYAQGNYAQGNYGQPNYGQPSYGQPNQGQANYPQPAPGYPAQGVPVPGQGVPVPGQGVPVPGGFPSQAPQATPVQPGYAQPRPPHATPVPGQSSSTVPAAARPVPAAPVPVGVGQQTSATIPAASRPVPVKPGSQPVPVTAGGQAGAVRDPSEEEEEGSDAARQAVRAAPPWLISLVVHMVALIILGLIALPVALVNQVDVLVQYAEEEGEQLIDDTLALKLDDPVDLQEAILTPDNLPPVDDPFAAPPELEAFDPNAVFSSEARDAPVGLALTGREKGMKQAMLAAYGGNATTEGAVKLGLEWLKRNQQNDGSWSLQGPYGDGALVENRVAATAMALLAFQGAGHTHRTGEFQNEVAKGWGYLLKMQNVDGNFFRAGDNTPEHHRLYTHAQAAIAVCELYGMTRDQAYREPAQKAIDYAVRAQDSLGGWRYVPGQDSDTSVTGWYVMALQSALMAGLEVPSPTLDKIGKFLDKVQSDGGASYGYKVGNAPTPAMTAEGLLCRQYLGWKHDDKRLLDGVEALLQNPIDYNEQNVYYWYYATQVTHHMEGRQWDRWNEVMRQAIPEAQTKTGKEAGSWSPARDRWGNHGGRLYTTCLSIYMLEVYYRHLPIYSYRVQ